MNAVQLQTLLEFDGGEFHAFQCHRAEAGREARHQYGRETQEWLLAAGMIVPIGGEFWLTRRGEDVRDAALFGAGRRAGDVLDVRG